MKLSGKKVLRSLLGGHQRYAIYGAGKCATDLLAYLLANDLPMPSVVLDDDPKNDMLLGVPVMAPRPDMRGQFDVVLLGTNTFQHDMRRRAREIFGTDTPVIDVLRDNFNTAEPAITEDTILNKNTDILFQMNRRDPQPNEKVKVDFLLHSAAHLSSCESILKACIADPNVQTKILVGQINEFRGQTRLESLGCELQRLENCNLDSDAHHALIVLRPYPSDFPAWMRVVCHFKEHGIRCVYVSYGIEYDDSRESGFLKTIHFRMSLHRHAWRIYTCSPVVRRDYGRYCSAGNAHVRYLGHPKLDIIHDSSRYPLPAELKDKIAGRRIVTWQLHYFDYSRYGRGGIIRSAGRFHNPPFKETKRILDYLQREQSDFFVLVTIHPLFHQRAVQEGVATQVEIDAFLARIESSENTAWYRELDYRSGLAAAEAFISEHSSLLIEMILTQKPVLYLEDIPVTHNEFGEGIISTYYKGTGLEDVIRYLDMLRRGEDSKKEDRRKALEEFIPLRDGKSGERIKDDIVRSIREESAHAASGERTWR